MELTKYVRLFHSAAIPCWIVWITCVFGANFWLPATTTTSAFAEDLMEEMVQAGIVLPNGNSIRLPPPSLSEMQSEAQRTEVLEALAGKLGWKRFARDSPVAPVTIRAKYLKNENGARIGHFVHSAFIAYASMEDLRNKQLMEATFGRMGNGSENDSTALRDLTAAELETLGLAGLSSDRESFAYMEMELLNKIVLRGIVHLQKEEGDHWFQLSWQFDPRFTQSKTDATSTGELENTWTKRTPNEVGKLQAGRPEPYQGLGGYMTVFETGKETDQLLIETRMVLYEPQDWFASSNALRAKLPLTLQESARSFRRKLSSNRTRR